jgi:hypothetical protein
VMLRCSRRVMGRIANLTLRQGGGEGIWLGVDIAQGASPFRGMRHHESKHRMRRNSRWSRSTAAPQPHPRWKDAGGHVDDNGQGDAGGQIHPSVPSSSWKFDASSSSGGIGRIHFGNHPKGERRNRRSHRFDRRAPHSVLISRPEIALPKMSFT